MRRVLGAVIGVAVGIVMVIAGVVPTAPAAEPKRGVTLRLDWYVYGLHAPFFVAQKQGFYSDANLDVKILEGNGSSATAVLIGNGSDTFGFADSGAAAKGISEGVPIKVVAGLLQRSSMTLTSFADREIRTPKDLEGKTLGIGAAEALTQVLPAFFAANGVDASKVRLVTMPPPARPAALLERRVDAIGGSIYGDALNLRLKNPDKKFNYLRFSDWKINMLGHGLLASNDMIAKSPDVVRRFVTATLRGWKYAKENPEAAVDVLLTQYPNLADNRAYFVEQVKMLGDFLQTDNSAGTPIGWQSEKDWASMQDLLLKYGGLSKQVPLNTYYVNDFVGR